MKVVSIVLLFLMVYSCAPEDRPDCFQSSGTRERRLISVLPFSRIRVEEGIELVVKQGDQLKVESEGGKNLLNEVTAIVEEGRLILRNDNSCQWIRGNNDPIRITIQTPVLTEIRTATQYAIRSEGILSFPSLALISEDFTENTDITVGIFDLDVATEKLTVVSNNISSFFIRGTAQSLDVNFASGMGRFEGGELRANTISVFHRGANDIIVCPDGLLTAQLRSTGDLIAVCPPVSQNIQTFYKGRFIPLYQNE